MDSIGAYENWSMDYNDEINSAPDIMINEGVEHKRIRSLSENFGLKMTLDVLLIAIIGLGIAVGVNNRRLGGVEISQDVNMPSVTRAIQFAEEVDSRIVSDSGYTYDDAVRDYLNAFDKAGKDAKIFVALEYAKYLSGIGKINDAIEFLTKEEDGLESDGYGWLNFYVTLANLYDEIGDDSGYRRYAGMFNSEV